LDLKKKKLKIAGPTHVDCEDISTTVHNMALVSIEGKISENNYLLLTMSRLNNGKN
jgi:hypothetical protein